MRSSHLLGLICVLVIVGCAESRFASMGTTTAQSAPLVNCDDENYLGPWTACPEADWVRSIVESAGYEVTGDTGSALVAAGDGDRFYIWATSGSGSLGSGSHVLCRTGGGEIWGIGGGMGDWRYWRAQGFTFWISAGPLMTSTSPDPCDLTALVQASLASPPPSVA